MSLGDDILLLENRSLPAVSKFYKSFIVRRDRHG